MTNQGNDKMTSDQAEALMRLINELGVCADVQCVQVLGWSRWGDPTKLRSYETREGDFVRGYWDGGGIFYVQRFRAGGLEWLEPEDVWLQRKLRFGFWVPWFKKAVFCFNEHLSLARCLNKRFADGDNAPLGVAELYQSVVVGFGLIWLLLIEWPLLPIFTTGPIRTIGALIALYPITELFVFSLHWIFVATGRLENYRRSLATFLFNLPSLAVFFTIVSRLGGCQSGTAWDAFWENLGSILQLKPAMVTNGSVFCPIVPAYQWLVGSVVILIILANLVSAIARGEK
jgi:hypothetical protein